MVVLLVMLVLHLQPTALSALWIVCRLRARAAIHRAATNLSPSRRHNNRRSSTAASAAAALEVLHGIIQAMLRSSHRLICSKVRRRNRSYRCPLRWSKSQFLAVPLPAISCCQPVAIICMPRRRRRHSSSSSTSRRAAPARTLSRQPVRAAMPTKRSLQARERLPV